MRGQLSLEYLMLALVALSLLAVSALALSKIKDFAETGFGVMRLRMDEGALAAAISEVCALGDGNGRELRLGGPVSIESAKAEQGWIIRLSGGGPSLVRTGACEAQGGKKEGLVYVENENGLVTVRGR